MELQFLNWLQTLHTPAGDVFWCGVTKLGDAGILWIVLAAILLIRPKTRRTGLILSLGLLADLALCNLVLKNLFARVRPFDVNPAVQLLVAKPKDFSFPSGHTAASFASVTALFFAGEKRGAKAALVIAVLIAFSRMYLYMHYPTDILGGALAGIASGYVGYQLFLLIERRWNKRK